MDYYKSSLGGVQKYYAADSSTGKVTIILNYDGLGMYNVLNQKLSKDSTNGTSDYDFYVSILETSTKSEFTTYADLTKTFLNSL